MAKRPTIVTVTSGWMSADTMNTNFSNIAAQFDNTVSRDASSPNAMAGDLDMDGNDILNVGQLDVASLTVNQIDIADIFTDTGNAGDLNSLVLSEGDLIYYNGTNLVRLAIGADGQILKVNSTVPAWEDAIDTDTVGVTVEEDDAAVQTNVTVINFITGGQGLVSSPVAGQVDVDLDSWVI